MSVERQLELLWFCFNMLFVWVKNKRLTHHPSDDLVACVFSFLALALSMVHCFGCDYGDYFNFVLGYPLFLSPSSVVRVTGIFAFTMTQNSLVMDVKM